MCLRRRLFSEFIYFLLLLIMSLLPHTPPYEVCDSPYQAEHYHNLGTKLGVSYLTHNLSSLGVNAVQSFSEGKIIPHCHCKDTQHNGLKKPFAVYYIHQIHTYLHTYMYSVGKMSFLDVEAHGTYACKLFTTDL